MNLQRLHKTAQQAQARADDRWSAFHAAIRDALEDGGSPTQIARDLGVTRVRVYQWRDKAR